MTATPVARPRLTLDQHLPNVKEIRDNLSAIVRAGEHLWLGGDEGTSIDRMTVDASGDFGEHHRFDLSTILPPRPPGDAGEIDIEGLDFDDGCLWLIGSHSKKRKKPEIDKPASKNRERLADVKADVMRHTLARVPLANGQPVASSGARTVARLRDAVDGGEGDELSQQLRADDHLKRFWEIPSKDNGIDVEGLAVSGHRVFAGLRGPVLRGWAVILEFAWKDASPGVMMMDGRLKKHFVQLEGLGVRELVIRDRDLFILAGPTMDLDGPVHVYRWRAALDAPGEAVVWKSDLSRVLTLPFGTGSDAGRDHAEGISLLEGPSARLLVCYDSPARGRLVEEQPELVHLDVFALDAAADA